MKCTACQYEWTPRTSRPVECPDCKARLNRQVKEAVSDEPIPTG